MMWGMFKYSQCWLMLSTNHSFLIWEQYQATKPLVNCLDEKFNFGSPILDCLYIWKISTIKNWKTSFNKHICRFIPYKPAIKISFQFLFGSIGTCLFWQVRNFPCLRFDGRWYLGRYLINIEKRLLWMIFTITDTNIIEILILRFVTFCRLLI